MGTQAAVLTFVIDVSSSGIFLDPCGIYPTYCKKPGEAQPLNTDLDYRILGSLNLWHQVLALSNLVI